MLFCSFTLDDPSSVNKLQDHYQYKARKYLIKHEVLWEYIDINSQGIDIFSSFSDKQNKKPECRIYWDEIETFKSMVKNLPYDEAFTMYKNKGTSRFNKDLIPEVVPVKFAALTSNYRLPLSGKKIAIDPGHIGNTLEMGVLESRFVKMDVGGEKIAFNEGELTYATAHLLKDLLEAKGAEVLLTRESCNTSALGVTFQEWYKNRMDGDIKDALAEGKITKEVAYWLKNEASEGKVFQKFFQNVDWRERCRLINNFRPDLTLIIHYNADEDNKTWTKPTTKNYNVAFVGGGYVKDELLKVEDRFQFLRQLITNDLENSVRLSGKLIGCFQECLKVPTIKKEEETYSIRNFSLPTSQSGVYARNLALTRYIMGPLCYGETLLQDNINEVKKLNKRDFTYPCGKTSSRVKDVADAYLKGILAYYNVQ